MLPVIQCICARFIPINCEISTGLAKLSKVGLQRILLTRIQFNRVSLAVLSV